MMSLTDFACYLCGGNSKVPVIRIGPHAVSCCTSCGLGFLDPPVPQGEKGVIYDEDFYTGQNMVKDTADGVQECVSKVRLVQRFVRSGRLLDIGCGLGYFLEAARRRGFSVFGMEGAGFAMEYVHREFGIPVVPAPVETTTLEEGTFDAVTLWHVIEHLPDPLAALRKIRSLLRDGGILIMETRNYRGYDARAQGERWGGWAFPHHLWHFDPGSYSLLVEKAGFRVVRLKIHNSDHVKKAIREIPLLGWLRNPVASFFAGSNQTIVAEKR